MAGSRGKRVQKVYLEPGESVRLRSPGFGKTAQVESRFYLKGGKELKPYAESLRGEIHKAKGVRAEETGRPNKPYVDYRIANYSRKPRKVRVVSKRVG